MQEVTRERKMKRGANRGQKGAEERRRKGEYSLTGFEQYFSGLLLDSISGCLEFTLGFLLTDLHYFRVLGHLVQLLG